MAIGPLQTNKYSGWARFGKKTRALIFVVPTQVFYPADWSTRHAKLILTALVKINLHFFFSHTTSSIIYTIRDLEKTKVVLCLSNITKITFIIKNAL